MGRERELIENLRVLNGFAYDVIARRRRQLQQQQQQQPQPLAVPAPAPGQESAQQQQSSQPAVAAETKNRHTRSPPAVEAKQSTAQPEEVSPRRQSHAPRRDDLLSLFLSAAAIRGEEISDRELRDVVVNFLIAGQPHLPALVRACRLTLTALCRPRHDGGGSVVVLLRADAQPTGRIAHPRRNRRGGFHSAMDSVSVVCCGVLILCAADGAA